jgi:hypothetical protein
MRYERESKWLLDKVTGAALANPALVVEQFDDFSLTNPT